MTRLLDDIKAPFVLPTTAVTEYNLDTSPEAVEFFTARQADISVGEFLEEYWEMQNLELLKEQSFLRRRGNFEGGGFWTLTAYKITEDEKDKREVVYYTEPLSIMEELRNVCRRAGLPFDNDWTDPRHAAPERLVRFNLRVCRLSSQLMLCLRSWDDGNGKRGIHGTVEIIRTSNIPADQQVLDFLQAIAKTKTRLASLPIYPARFERCPTCAAIVHDRYFLRMQSVYTPYVVVRDASLPNQFDVLFLQKKNQKKQMNF